MRSKICGESLWAAVYDIIDQKKKAGCLSLSYNLLNWNLNSKHHSYSWEHWEHSYQVNIFCVAFIGADYNRSLWIYKITRFSYCIDKGWVVVVVVVVEGDIKFWKFAREWTGGVTKNGPSANKGGGGSKFWSFCEIVIIEFPLSLKFS